MDIVIIVVSSLCAIASGAALPLMTVIFGNLQGTFQSYFNHLSTYDDFMSEMNHLVLYFVYLAIGEFVTTYVSTVGFIYTGEHISAKIREHYLESCMKQNIGFFDKLGAGEVTTRITSDTNLIQDGISEKIGLTMASFATFIADEAIFMGAGEAPRVLRGKPAIVAAWKQYFDGPTPPFSWEPEIVEVLDSGSLALTSGPVHDPGGGLIGLFNSIWRLEADGRWRVLFDRGSQVCPVNK